MMTAQDESLIRLSLQHYEMSGEYRDPSQFQHQLMAPPPDAVRPGCFVALLGHLFRPLVGGTAAPAGSAAKKPNKVTEKLDAASSAIESRAAGLTERATTLRATAKTLFANGDKRGAMAMLRRAKTAEKAAETAQATALSLEQQRDLLESAAVQKSVSEALAVAVKKSKRSTRGLLSKAEQSVEESAEIQDLHSDLAQVMGELGQHGTEAFDEDDLAAELEELCRSDDGAPAAPAPTRTVAKPAAVTAPSPDSVVVSMDALRQYPRVPTQVHAVQGMAVSAPGV